MRRFLLLVLLIPAISLGQARMGDADCDGSICIGDAVTLIEYIFKGGEAPCELYLPKLEHVHTSTSGTYTIAMGWEPIAQVSIDVSTSGEIFVTANCSHFAQYGGGPNFGLDTTSYGASLCSAHPYNNNYEDLDEELSYVMPVSAGTYTFFYNIMINPFGPDNRPITFDDVRLTATFYPNPPETKK